MASPDPNSARSEDKCFCPYNVFVYIFLRIFLMLNGYSFPKTILGNMISAEAYFIRKDDIRSQEVDERDRAKNFFAHFPLSKAFWKA